MKQYLSLAGVSLWLRQSNCFRFICVMLVFLPQKIVLQILLGHLITLKQLWPRPSTFKYKNVFLIAPCLPCLEMEGMKDVALLDAMPVQ